jgi:hypothetical protein
MFCGKPLNGSASERACSVGKSAKKLGYSRSLPAVAVTFV